MRLLHARPDLFGSRDDRRGRAGLAEPRHQRRRRREHRAGWRGDPGADERQPVPLRRLCEHCCRDQRGRCTEQPVIPFDYQRATDADSAVATLAGRPRAVFLASGTNLVDHLKLGVLRPELLIDVSGLPLATMDALLGGGPRIVTMVRNSDLAAHPLIRRSYPALA